MGQPVWTLGFPLSPRVKAVGEPIDDLLKSLGLTGQAHTKRYRDALGWLIAGMAACTKEVQIDEGQTPAIPVSCPPVAAEEFPSDPPSVDGVGDDHLSSFSTEKALSDEHGQVSPLVALEVPAEDTFYSGRGYPFRRRAVQTIVDRLTSFGLVTRVHRGRRFLADWKNERGGGWIEPHYSLFVVTPSGREWLRLMSPELSVVEVEAPKDVRPVLVIRDKNKKDLPLPDTEEAAVLLTGLERLNELNAQHVFRWIEGTSGRELTATPTELTYRRIFRDNLNAGGRCFNGLSNLSKQDRATLTIDGQPTVELDLSSAMIRLAYGIFVGQNPGTGDLYRIGDHDRESIKTVATIAIGAASRRSQLQAIAGNLAANGLTPPDLDKKYALKHARRLLEAFEERHNALSPYLWNSAWKPLQRAEGALSVMLMSAVTNSGHGILSFHDSWRVPEGIVDEVRALLHRLHEQVIGIPAVISE